MPPEIPLSVTEAEEKAALELLLETVTYVDAPVKKDGEWTEDDELAEGGP